MIAPSVDHVIIVLTICCALVLPEPSMASWRATVDSLYSSAEESFSASEYGAAAASYERVVEVVSANDGAAIGPYFAGLLARSRFLAARSHEERERWDEAIAAYTECLTELDVIADAVRTRLARCHREKREWEAAIVQLRRIIEDSAETTFDVAAIEALGDTYTSAEEHSKALQWYRTFLAKARSYDDRARAHYKIGLTYERGGDEDAAKGSFATAVNDFPRSRHSYTALKHARKISRAFTDRYHQGLVLYNRRHFRDSSEYFSYYLRHDREREFVGEATYFLGRGYQRTRRYSKAAARYDDVIELGETTEYYELAWLKLGYCLRASGGVDEGLATYDRFVAMHPESEIAPEAMWDKARLLEEEQRWAEAHVAYRDVSDRYPSSEFAGDALFRAGICLFKLGDYVAAERTFADLYLDSEGDEAARALFWGGKSRERVSRPGEALVRFAEAGEAARDSYYGRRSLAKLDGAPDGVASDAMRRDRSFVNAGGRNGRVRWDGETHDFATWLAEWYDRVYLPVERQALIDQLSRESEFVRADVLLALHMRREALAEFEALEDRVGRDPRMLDVLLNYYEDHGLNRRAIQMAERILALSPAESVSDAPVYLRKKICPRHFSEVVVPECLARGIDPDLFYSLMRQESLFEPEAVSWAGARGLAQIMPSTGKWVARRLGQRGFKVSQLLDADTSIRFGTYYLSTLIEDFEGDFIRALAAYNGGPDNTERWWGYGGTDDVDVFVEDIGFSETANYVRRVVRYYSIYSEIYGGDSG